MRKVFIGGSRRLSRLNRDVKGRLDNIVKQRLTVLVGDANGADRTVQQYLASKRYDKVIVFCAARECRNNIGKWPARYIGSPQQARRDFTYYATKDRTMVNETDYGLMLWDGKSRGTLTSIVDLLHRGKPVVVYLAPGKSFHTLSKREELTVLLPSVDPSLVQQIERDLRTAGRPTPAGSRQKAYNMSLF